MAALSGLAVVLAFLILVQAVPSRATPVTTRVTPYGVFGRAGNNHRAGKVVARFTALSGTPYVYALDGTSPDGITVYSVSHGALTQIQQVTVGSSTGMYYGAHLLRLGSPVAGQACLYFSEGGTSSVYSFTVASNGMLSTTPVSTVTVGGFPQDLAFDATSPLGPVLLVSNSNPNNPTPSLQVLSAGSGCALGTPTTTLTGSQEDVNIAVENSNTIVTADANSGDWETYTINDDGSLTNIQSAPPQSGFYLPDSVVALSGGSIQNVYAGQANAEQPTAVEGASYAGASGAYSPLAGSPASNAGCDDGAAIAGSIPDRLVIQAGVFNGAICWDTLTASGMSVGSSTNLAVTDDDPANLDAVGNTLVVAQAYGGDLEACDLSTSGVSGCRTIATLPGSGSGDEGSVAILP